MLYFMQSTEDLIRVPAAAEILGVNASTVTRWIQAGKLTPAEVIDGVVFLDRGTIIRLYRR